MSKPLFVFYEDKLAQSEIHFGPHVLALSCLVDLRGERESRWQLSQRVRHLCKNGVSKLIADAHRFEDIGRKVLAPDDDRLREHLQLAPATTDSEVVVELGRRTRTPPGQIILIVRNMDDLAREAAAAMGAIPGTVEKPSRQQRDRYCHDLAAAPGRSERDRFLDAMPSFRRLVEVLNRLLAAAGNS